MRNSLKQIREKRGLTQQHLAALLNVSQRTISKWETGKSTPSAAQMQFLQEFFHVGKEDIFFEAFNYNLLLNIKVPTAKNSNSEEVS